MSRAVTISGYGPPSVLHLEEVGIPAPGPHQIRVAVRYAGVGPTDLAVRAGHLDAVFPVRPGGVLGFEAAGTVEAVGDEVTDVVVGDDVAVHLPGSLGGYAELVVADLWVRRPSGSSWTVAAALPASAEAAVRGLALLGPTKGETLLLLGGNGSVGALATQLAVAAGVEVITTVRPDDADEVTARGAVPVDYHQPLRDAVRSPVDAVLDASGRSDLEAAVALAGGPARVVTLSDPRAGQFGVTLSAPDPATVPAALAEAAARVEDGTLTVREPTVAPLRDAAEVHTGLEAGTLRGKIVLQP
ncbi:alcohol dehydrogenase catalytic domain-containing protein [Actinomycetospora sp. TBRC 11914]|uniref:alcohol dehydrogenase catalytic domain-containing protein n=1 Tax=Actinomycetospora sp. TBRC 11914 TaxID=2729387 RepID=UPI00145F7150|nr:zinc-binding dehydrogenase [Actinomycetospora sp. TBRC 11914]NMO91342.1 zinc-binding dehydrogenase [Actinomycetospora sp. TBRC 11914]